MQANFVAPLVGAWIEIGTTGINWKQRNVAPLVGAWIEINRSDDLELLGSRRSPRGSVD